jgi:hypothetical protein
MTAAYNTKHKQVFFCVRDMEAEVDEGIAPVIKALWEHGIETTMSCQEDEWGMVWIQFPPDADLTAFIETVAIYEPGANSLYSRAIPYLAGAEPPSWEFAIFPTDVNLEYDGVEWRHLGPTSTHCYYNVRFPPCDIPLVMDRLGAAPVREPVRKPRPFRTETGQAAATRDLFPALEAKLLAIAGKRVVFMPEPHIVMIVEHGELIGGLSTRVVRGMPHRCHLNVARRYLARPGRYQIATGYGLTREDGMWRPYSWLFDGLEITETTVPRDAYFGVLLDRWEAASFVLGEVHGVLRNTVPRTPQLDSQPATRSDADVSRIFRY